MNYSDQLKQFISNNDKLIDNFQFDKLYEKCDQHLRAELTQLFLDVGINPLDYMTVIPNQMYYTSPIKTLNIPKNIITIGNGAFDRCYSLTSVNIPEGVTSIGSWAFVNCHSLTSITIPAGVTSIGRGAFYNCNSLTSVTLFKNSQLISINDTAFYGCDSLTSIEIPDGVTSIGDRAFDDCSSLTSIMIPASVTSISDKAFNIGQLIDIIYKGTKKQWKGFYNPSAFLNTPFTVHCTDGDLIKKIK